MEETKSNKPKTSGKMWKGILKYGILIGLGLIIIVLIRFWINKPIAYPIGYSEYVSLLIFMFIGGLLYKKGLEESRITFKKSYFMALGSGIIGSIIYGMFIYLYSQYIDVDFQERCFDIQRAVKANAQLTNEQIKSMVSPSSIALTAILFASFMSILWGLVVALFLRNTKKDNKAKEIENLD
jgi:hypothetical protein